MPEKLIEFKTIFLWFCHLVKINNHTRLLYANRQLAKSFENATNSRPNLIFQHFFSHPADWRSTFSDICESECNQLVQVKLEHNARICFYQASCVTNLVARFIFICTTPIDQCQSGSWYSIYSVKFHYTQITMSALMILNLWDFVAHIFRTFWA